MKVFYFETDNESGTGKIGTFPQHYPEEPCAYIEAADEGIARAMLAEAGFNVTAIEEICE
jgi:hypothetical protein